MTKALILFTDDSVAKGQAYPEELKALLEAAASDLQIVTATYSQLLFNIDGANTAIKLTATGDDLADFDVVYMRRIQENAPDAMAVGKYCLHKGIPLIDRAIALRAGSMNKLTQYFQFTFADLPVPATRYSPSADVLLADCVERPLKYPVIVKAVKGSRGSDNYMVASLEELQELVRAQPRAGFLVQEYIANSGDYRVWVRGDRIGPVLYRSRASGHMNNTSQGGNAELVDPSVLPDQVRADCIRATMLLDRDIAGVDVVFEHDDLQGRYLFFESNRAPQIEGTPFQEVKAEALAHYMVQAAEGQA